MQQFISMENLILSFIFKNKEDIYSRLTQKSRNFLRVCVELQKINKLETNLIPDNKLGFYSLLLLREKAFMYITTTANSQTYER